MTKDNKPAEKAAHNEKRQDANPEVRSSDNFDDTPEKVEQDLKGLSEQEKRTGVRDEEVDTSVTIDPSATDEKKSDLNTFKQPWEEYQTQAEAQRAADSAKSAKAMQDRHKKSAK